LHHPLSAIAVLPGHGDEESGMTGICWKSAVTWGLLGLMFLLFVLIVGPLPALAANPDAVLYEVTEDMYLKDASGNFVSSVATAARRNAVAQLSGWAKIGTPICPAYIKVVPAALQRGRERQVRPAEARIAGLLPRRPRSSGGGRRSRAFARHADGPARDRVLARYSSSPRSGPSQNFSARARGVSEGRSVSRP